MRIMNQWLFTYGRYVRVSSWNKSSVKRLQFFEKRGLGLQDGGQYQEKQRRLRPKKTSQSEAE